MAICSSLKGGRVVLRPVGSPIIAVKSPIKKTAVCPRSWNRRMRSSGTVWPRCRSGAVGSNPIFTRSGTFFSSLRRRSSRVWTSTAPRVTSASCCSGVMSLLDALDAQSAAGGIVDLDDGALQMRLPARHLEGGVALGEEALDGGLLAHSDHAVPGPAHADVGDERGAAAEHARVSGLDMRMRAEDGGDAAVEILAHRVFLAGGLAVHVDQDAAHPEL